MSDRTQNKWFCLHLGYVNGRKDCLGKPIPPICEHCIPLCEVDDTLMIEGKYLFKICIFPAKDEYGDRLAHKCNIHPVTITHGEIPSDEDLPRQSVPED